MTTVSRVARAFLPLWMFVCLEASLATAADTWRVTIHGNGINLGETPISATVDRKIPVGAYLLVPKGGGTPIVAFVTTLDGTRLNLVLPRLGAQAVESYELRDTLPVDPKKHCVEIDSSGPNPNVKVGGELFTTLVLDTGPKPFLFPLIGPTGAAITRAYPMRMVSGEDQDHPHQRSFWFTHGKVNGIDFWAELKGHGTIRPTTYQTQSGESAAGAIAMTNDWLGPNGEKVCEESRLILIYATKEARVLDFDISIKASTGPVTFGDTKEGMFGLRVASSMDAKRKPGGKITNAEGITDGAAWGKASKWVDYTGPVEGQTVGIAIMNHPNSFRYPTTWHVRDYGLFAANPFGWHDFGMDTAGDHTIPAGGSMTFRYRVILHRGDTASADLPTAFDAFVHPPRVVVGLK